MGDPSNPLYVQSYTQNLQKKYDNNRKGAPLAWIHTRSTRSAMKKAMDQEQWDEVIKQGLAVLRVNPWDVPALRAMATAAEHSGDAECELHYLKCALEANPKDPETNKQCALAMTERDQFDQAIACWHRVEQVRPDDEEVQRAIAELAVRKTIKKGGYEETDPNKKFRGAKAGAAAPQEEVPAEEILRRKVARDPGNLVNYMELGQLLVNSDEYEEAEELYTKALEVSGDDADVREKLYDLQVRRVRHDVVRARQHRKDSPAAEQEYRRLRKELNLKEVERCKHLCEHYPNNLRFRYDLGVQYQIAKEFPDAIREFQQAKNDPRCKGLCLLGLGQCFQAIQQTRLAVQHYEMAIAEIPDRDAPNKRESLYLAGKLALEQLGDLDAAEKHLTDLASLDFTYKDVSELLAKLAQLRGGDAGAPGSP
jgi:tetratricopeptide (TPR) repeat protein